MAKDKSTSRKKDPKSLRTAKSSVASQGQRVLSDAKKLTLSINKLFLSSLKSVVVQCHGVFVAGRKQLYTSFQRVVRECRRVKDVTKETCKSIAGRCSLILQSGGQYVVKNYRLAIALTQQSYFKLADISRKVLDITRLRIVNTGIRITSGYLTIRFAIKQTCNSVAGRCNLIFQVAGQWIVKNYRRAISLTKQSYVQCVDLSRKGLDAARQGMVQARLKALTHYHRAGFGVKRAYQNLVNLSSQGLENGRQKIDAIGLGVTRKSRRVHRLTVKAHKKFIRLCREGFRVTKRGILTVGLKVIAGYRKACLATRQSCQSLAARSLQKLMEARLRLVKSVTGQYRKVCIAYQKFVRLCHEGFNAAKRGIFAIGQKVAAGYRKACLATKQSCQSLVARSLQKLTEGRLRLFETCTRQYQKVRLAHQKLVHFSREGFSTAKQGILAVGLKVAAGYRKACLAARQSCQSLITRTLQKLTEARLRIVKTVTRQYRKIRSAHKKFIRLCREGFRAAKRGILTVGLKVAAGYRKACLATKQSCQSLVAGSFQKLTEAKLRLVKTVTRQYQKVRLAHQKLVHFSREGFNAAKRGILAVGLTVAAGYRKTCLATKQSCQSLAARSLQKLD